MRNSNARRSSRSPRTRWPATARRRWPPDVTTTTPSPSTSSGSTPRSRPCSLRPDRTSAYSGLLLSVDDNEANRDMLSRRLARRGHSVTVAENGTQALERIGSDEFDLVLLDVVMPDIDGFEVLERVRRTR